MKKVTKSEKEFVIFELGNEKKTDCLDLIAKKLEDYDKFKLIRVPYFNPRSYKESDKYEPDFRELDETDPIFKVSQKDITRIRVGAPIVLQHLVDSFETHEEEEEKPTK